MVKHGRRRVPPQYPPPWRHPDELRDCSPGEKTRRRRNFAAGRNPYHSYTVGVNVVVLTGIVHRPPRMAGKKRQEMCWFRITVPDPDNPERKLYIPIKTRGALAFHCFANVEVGTLVYVRGRIYTGQLYRVLDSQPKKGKQWRQFIYMIADEVQSNLPVQLDLDPRFVRVRYDLWNRILGFVEELSPLRIPERAKRELLEDLQRQIDWYDSGAEEAPERDLEDPGPERQDDANDERSSPGSR